ncbi:MAG TPA: hypothetical protein VJB62_02895 [Patescibacteria group bacterium]|nr:hypothetical protein [Patescibacteria group bacterium]
MTRQYFKRKIRNELLKRAFSQGFGGLLTLGSVLMAGFMIWLNQPFFGFLTVLTGLLGAGFMFWQNSHNQEIQREIVEWVVKKNYSPDESEKNEYAQELNKGIKYAQEIIVKIMEILSGGKHGENLNQLIDDVDEMMALQYESAKQAEELRRVLDLVLENSGHRRSADRQLRETNVNQVRTTILEAENSIVDINEKLSILVLQTAQMDQETSDRVNAAALATETSGTLKKLQAIVNARRETADEIIGRLSYQH